jgi:hypothetical protein
MSLDQAPNRLTSARVRSSIGSSLERQARKYLARMEGLMLPLGTAGRPDARPRGPRRGDRERTLVLLAARYWELCRVGVDNPVATLAAERGLARGTVQSYLHEARRSPHKLLTSNGRGAKGGSLTPKAMALLAEIKKEQTA